MDKTKLAICIEDEEYEARFVKCVMNHYKQSYEIHVVNSIREIAEGHRGRFNVVITGDGKGLDLFSLEECILFVLQEDVIVEDSSSGENIFYTEKFQEVYKIMEELEKSVNQRFFQRIGRVGSKDIQMIGVFSLGKEEMQIPFTALLAEILGEKSSVLVIDMQPYSGFQIELEVEEDALGMEDVMTVATTEIYTNRRLAASIGHEQKWDFIYPAKNAECLGEANRVLYKKMIHILQKEREYEQVILNFGAVFSGMTELMDDCQHFYFLTEKKEERNWREKAFFDEMRGRGKESFLQKIIWMDIPVHFTKERSWRQLTRSWLWSELGDKLREMNWMEN